ncbi:prostatic glandular kallikrein-6-like [Schistocerca gregaria]|uniref:prostatic glandular kallikrein-6-like n=1 Tax=Schistocerca gregaria TaxID=7010 RepID=UPI00211DBA88|nr:prostatic glandular kallikrein-6-like [Schistocerca gregaria]
MDLNKIVAGINSLTNDPAIEQTVQVAQQIRHPSYQEDFNVAINDVTIFQLKTSLSLGGNVQAIPLPTSRSVPSAGSSATLSGWGSTSTRIGMFPDMPDILQWVDVTAISNTECAQLVPDSPVNDNNVCTGPVDGSISACTGDSGGPLTQDGTLIGIASWGIWPCGTVGAPSVFTRVAAYTHFINQYI